jgi:hypothetical protein
MTILMVEHAAAVRRTRDLSLYLGELETCRRRAQDLCRADDVEAINAMIRSVNTDYQDTQAIVDAFERQESGRRVAREMGSLARGRLEQLVLAPRPRAVGVL